MAYTNVVSASPQALTRPEGLARSLLKWRALFEQAPLAIFIFDDERRFVEANGAACELFDAPLDQIIGAHVTTFVVPPEMASASEAQAGSRWASFLRSGSEAGECTILRADGTKRYADFHARANFQPGLHLCFAHDGTERKLADEVVRRAENLYRGLIDTMKTGYLVTDQEGRVLDANAEYLRLTGAADLDTIRWGNVLQWTAPADRAKHGAGIADCIRTGVLRDLAIHFESRAGVVIPVELNATALPCDQGLRLLWLCRDISHREASRRQVETAWHELEARVQQRTAQLEQANEQSRGRARQQEAVVEFGRTALVCEDLTQLLQSAAEMVARLLDIEFTMILEHADPPSEQLLLRACHGWAGALGEPTATTDPATLAGHVIASGASIAIDDFRREPRFQPLPGMPERGGVSGIVVAIPGDERPFGLIGGHTARARQFTQDDLHFVQSVANLLAAAVERARADRKARLAQEAAAKANGAKLDFLSRMSHELRTPLNAILGFGQLLEIEVLEARHRESVDQIISAGRHLLHLVNEVLDISRIESGKFTFALEPLAVADLLTEAVDLMRPLAGAGEGAITIHLEAPEPELHVLADHQSIRQVLLNLLSNAVKYNRPGGKVSVSAQRAPDGRSVRLLVADTGVGIPTATLPRLFTPFDRLGAEHTAVEGSGIGLALSKRLMDGQGGQLGVESVEGEGSTFRLDLPMAAEPAEGFPAAPFEELLQPASILVPGGANVQSAVKDQSQPMRTILHIEDNEQNRRLMELLLDLRPGLSLLTASRGEQGLELARAHRPHLILLDMHLPDTCGEDVLNALRADPHTKDTPIVVVSADASALRQENLRLLGANDYLTKPFNVKEFLLVVDQFLGETRGNV